MAYGMENNDFDQFLQNCGLGREERHDEKHDFDFDESEFGFPQHGNTCGGEAAGAPVMGRGRDCGCEEEDESEYICQQCFMQGVRAGMQKGFKKGYEHGFNKGKEVGFKAGYNKGYSDGCKASFEKGYKAGYEKGFKAGYHKGYEAGAREGFEKGSRVGYEKGFKAGYERAYRELMSCMRNIAPNGGGSCGENQGCAPKRHC